MEYRIEYEVTTTVTGMVMGSEDIDKAFEEIENNIIASEKNYNEESLTISTINNDDKRYY